MTNAEKYKDAIRAQICKTGDWRINKQGEVEECIPDGKHCMFTNAAVCGEEKINWLLAEADKKKVFSEKDKAVLRALDKVQWVARDKDGKVFGYCAEPIKSDGAWLHPKGRFVHLTPFTTAEFAPVKWEDDEPTNRAEILGDEE